MFIQKYFEKLTRNVDIVVQFNMRKYIEWKSEKTYSGDNKHYRVKIFKLYKFEKIKIKVFKRRAGKGIRNGGGRKVLQIFWMTVYLEEDCIEDVYNRS